MRLIEVHAATAGEVNALEALGRVVLILRPLSLLQNA
jgi:hypothetical protein